MSTSKDVAQGMENDLVPLKPCLIMVAIVIALMLGVIAWLSWDGISRAEYWETQVDWFVELNQLFSTNPALWLNLTQLGDAWVLLPLLSFLIITSPNIWAGFFGAIPLGTLLIRGGKDIAAIPRPAAVLDQNLIHIVGEKLTGHNSLPSGHTGTVFIAGTVLMLFVFFAQKRNVRWWTLAALFGITSILALSRIAVGAHWPLDLFFGAICGFIGGLSGVALVQKYSGWWTWLKQSKHYLIPALILLPWSISLLPVLHRKPPETTFVFYLAAMIGIAVSCYMLYRRFQPKHN